MGGLLDPWRWPVFALQAVALFFVATLVFDVIHYILHQFLNSRYPLIRRIGLLHQAHHDFFGRQLDFDDRLVRDNLVKHVIPEYLNQVVITASALVILEPAPVAAALLFETAIFLGVVRRGGKDRNHIPYDAIPASGGALLGLLVTPAYHALHHVYPDRYYSSWTTLFDRLAGTASRIRGRRVAMTGASGSFGKPLKALLEREGAAEIRTLKFGCDYTYDDYGRLDDALREAEVLVLCHGSKSDHAMEANCDSFVALIERFRALAADRQIPAEVWAVGSEIEAHPAFGIPELVLYRDSKRAFARHARRYYGDRRLVYRHIVPSAFMSPMGPGLMSGSFAARVALFLIRRGFRYVPVTYTGVAFFNYFKFLSLTPASPAACARAGSIAHAAPQRQGARPEGRAGAKEGSSPGL